MIIRRVKLNIVSYDGTQKINNVAKRQKMLLLSIISFEEKIASANPRKSAPQSPINIFARGKLCGRKPIIAANNIKEQSKILLFPQISEIATRQSA